MLAGRFYNTNKMNYLYINLPKLPRRKIDFSVLQKGDALEVRLNELPQSKFDEKSNK